MRLAEVLTSSCSEWRIRSVSAAHSFLMGVVTYSHTLTLSLRKSSCQLDLWPSMQNHFHPAGVLPLSSVQENILFHVPVQILNLLCSDGGVE